MNRSAIPHPPPYRSGVMSTDHSGYMRQLLNDVYIAVAKNQQKDVEVEVSYEFEAENTAATAPETGIQ